MGGVLSLLVWALPHKAPPSGHKRPLATHMRGDVLAFPDQDRSHTCSVRDRPTQLCIDRKAGRHSPQPREWLHPACPPLFPTCCDAPGWVGASRVRIAAEQEPRPDLIYLLGNDNFYFLYFSSFSDLFWLEMNHNGISFIFSIFNYFYGIFYYASGRNEMKQ